MNAIPKAPHFLILCKIAKNQKIAINTLCTDLDINNDAKNFQTTPVQIKCLKT